MLRGNLVIEYYSRIDSGHIDWVMGIFSSEAVYQRAGTLLDGIDAIGHFFNEERKIRGTHRLDAIWSFGSRVICTGIFEGVGAEGDNRSVLFFDFWLFNPQGLVIERRTYLGLGHQYVKE